MTIDLICPTAASTPCSSFGWWCHQRRQPQQSTPSCQQLTRKQSVHNNFHKALGRSAKGKFTTIIISRPKLTWSQNNKFKSEYENTFILSFARPHLIAEAEPLGQIAGPSRNPSTPERQNTRKANWQSSGDGNTKCQRKGETLELLCFKLFGVLTFESWPLSFSHLSFDFAYHLHFLGLRSKENYSESSSFNPKYLEKNFKKAFFITKNPGCNLFHYVFLAVSMNHGFG